MGFSKDAIMNSSFPSDSLGRTKVDLLNSELGKIAGIQNVSFSVFTPANTNGNWATDLRLPGNNSSTPDMIVNYETGRYSLLSVI